MGACATPRAGRGSRRRRRREAGSRRRAPCCPPAALSGTPLPATNCGRRSRPSVERQPHGRCQHLQLRTTGRLLLVCVIPLLHLRGCLHAGACPATTNKLTCTAAAASAYAAAVALPPATKVPPSCRNGNWKRLWQGARAPERQSELYAVVQLAELVPGGLRQTCADSRAYLGQDERAFDRQRQLHAVAHSWLKAGGNSPRRQTSQPTFGRISVRLSARASCTP